MLANIESRIVHIQTWLLHSIISLFKNGVLLTNPWRRIIQVSHKQCYRNIAQVCLNTLGKSKVFILKTDCFFIITKCFRYKMNNWKPPYNFWYSQYQGSESFSYSMFVNSILLWRNTVKTISKNDMSVVSSIICFNAANLIRHLAGITVTFCKTLYECYASKPIVNCTTLNERCNSHFLLENIMSSGADGSDTLLTEYLWTWISLLLSLALIFTQKIL